MTAGERPNALLTATLDFVYVVAGAFSLLVGLLRGRLSRAVDHLRRRAFEPCPLREGSAPCVWLHAVSVGEVLTIRRLVGRLAERLPDHELAISVSTRAGLEAARTHFPDSLVFSCPLDASWLVRRTLDRIRPRAIFIVEHDIWPNLVRIARARGVPVGLINARLSPGSLAGYRRLSRVYPWPPRDLAVVCVQDDISAAAFRALGFPAGLLDVCGNLKFENPPPPAVGLRAELGFSDGDRVLVAGSTHDPEEVAVLDAFESARARHGDTWLILVPRRIERVEELERLVEARGLTHARWTRLKRKGPDVLIVDTVGELARISSVGDLVFVGGSLAPIGGHNVIEPAAFGRPVVIGPRFENFTSIVETFRSVDAIRIVEGAEGLVERVVELLSDREAARALGERGRRVVEENAGALERTIEAMVRVLDGVGRSGSE